MSNIANKAWHITGLAESYKMMDDLTCIEKQKVILSILKKAGNKNIKAPLIAANKFKNSKKQPGKSLIVTTNDPQNPLGIKIGVSGKFFYLRFADMGTAQRFTKTRALVKVKRKSGKPSKGRIKITGNKFNRGKMPQLQDLHSVIVNNITNVINYINDNYTKETMKRLRALAKKNKL